MPPPNQEPASSPRLHIAALNCSPQESRAGYGPPPASVFRVPPEFLASVPAGELGEVSNAGDRAALSPHYSARSPAPAPPSRRRARLPNCPNSPRTGPPRLAQWPTGCESSHKGCRWQQGPVDWRGKQRRRRRRGNRWPHSNSSQLGPRDDPRAAEGPGMPVAGPYQASEASAVKVSGRHLLCRALPIMLSAKTAVSLHKEARSWGDGC